MNKLKTILFFCGLFLSISVRMMGQDPSLPPANLGLPDLMDGLAGPPGVLYVNYLQGYHTMHIMDQYGHRASSDLKIDPLLSMNQVIVLTPVKLLGGNLGFTVLIPIVKLSATNGTDPAPSVNPAVLGDPVQGTAIQWSGKKLFNKPLSHRVELDISLPVGSYSSAYVINPSAHLYTFSFYHAFTFSLAKSLNLSMRNQFNYNTRIIGTAERPGMFYNGNYSLEYKVVRNFWVEWVGYYLSQLRQDSYAGDSHYYQRQFSIADTREDIVGMGGGVGSMTAGNVLLEGKMFWELAGKNRTEGIRPTLRIAIPLTR